MLLKIISFFSFLSPFSTLLKTPHLSFAEPNTERFKQMLIYFSTDTQYAHFWGTFFCLFVCLDLVLIPWKFASALNKRSFEPFCVWIFFENASSHSVSDFFFQFHRANKMFSLAKHVRHPLQRTPKLPGACAALKLCWGHPSKLGPHQGQTCESPNMSLTCRPTHTPSFHPMVLTTNGGKGSICW